MYICSVEPENKLQSNMIAVIPKQPVKRSFGVHHSHLLKWVWSNGKKISTGWRVFLSDQGQRVFIDFFG